MTTDYSDIIALPRHVSKKHAPMSVNNRAAQFAPYAALAGHKDIITHNENTAAQRTNLDAEIDLILDAES